MHIVRVNTYEYIKVTINNWIGSTHTFYFYSIFDYAQLQAVYVKKAFPCLLYALRLVSLTNKSLTWESTYGVGSRPTLCLLYLIYPRLIPFLNVLLPSVASTGLMRCNTHNINLSSKIEWLYSFIIGSIKQSFKTLLNQPSQSNTHIIQYC